MTAASAIDELYRIETWNTRSDIIGNLKDTGLFPDEWILERFTDMSRDEIKQMQSLSDQHKQLSRMREEVKTENDRIILSEYEDFLRRSRIDFLDYFENNGVSYFVNSKELDGLPDPSGDGLLVENSVDDELRLSTIFETKGFLTNQDEETIDGSIIKEVAESMDENEVLAEAVQGVISESKSEG
jgi:hypothetical protein